MPTFEENAKDIVWAAGQIARAQNAEPDATILENASASLIYAGNDNDGGSLYALTLEVPIKTYVAVEEYRDGLEQSIRERIRPIIRRYPGSWVSEVIIVPELKAASPPAARASEVGQESEDTLSFWQTGFFRLFISHTSATKSSAHNLKAALGKFQVAAFVAHDDIEPTREWQLEIERALRTADALAAIITPDFVESSWCDQEVGFAFGRGKLVVPLCKESVPHGFLGRYQGFKAQGLNAVDVATQVFEILLVHALSAERMADALVEGVASAWSFQGAMDAMALLERVPKLTEAQVARLVQSITNNEQVGNAFGVPDRIRALVSLQAPLAKLPAYPSPAAPPDESSNEPAKRRPLVGRKPNKK
jgi:TIR domain-containing protein